MKEKIPDKYKGTIAQELRLELIKRSPSASYVYILAGITVAFTAYGQQYMRSTVQTIGAIAAIVSIVRLFFSKKIIKDSSLTETEFRIHNLMIVLNATCWSAIFSLICIGSPVNTMAFGLAVMVTFAISMGGISSLSPHPLIQNYFFVTNLLLPAIILVFQEPLEELTLRHYITPGLLSFAFLYVFTQSKRFYINLIQRYTSELMLKDERDHLQTVIDSIPGFLIYLDSNLSITYVTRNLDKKLGTSFKQGQSLADILFDLATQVRAFKLSDKTYDTKEICLNTFVGDEWFLLSFYKADQGQNIIVVGAPIGELVKTRNDLAERSIKAMNASKLASLGEMAAGAAHEINNPVAIVHGYLTEMKKIISKEEFPSKPVFSEKILKASKTLLRINKIVSGLRLLSRDAEDDPFNLAPLNTILEDTLSLVQDKFTQSAIKLEIDPVPDIKMQCRPTQVSQVLLNIINNAYDAVQNSAKKVVQVKFEQNSERVKIIVKDSGPGIPQELSEKIFEPFFTTKDPGKGTGLGLSISKSIMDAHKGKITCHNDHGAEFILEFPLKISGESAA